MQKKDKIMVGIIGTVAAVGILAAAVPNHQTQQAMSIPQAELITTKADGEGITALQVIEINAKGGYIPNMMVAKANQPTLLRIKTNSTFDCSAALVIPSLGYRTRLPMTGVTSVNIPPQAAGGELTGLCSMGMYRFTIKFVG